MAPRALKWTVWLATGALLFALPAWGDDRPPGQQQTGCGTSSPPPTYPTCELRANGDPCHRENGLCGTCVVAQGQTDGYCENVHTCADGEAPGCNATTAMPPALTTMAGLFLGWLATRRRGRR